MIWHTIISRNYFLYIRFIYFWWNNIHKFTIVQEFAKMKESHNSTIPFVNLRAINTPSPKQNPLSWIGIDAFLVEINSPFKKTIGSCIQLWLFCTPKITWTYKKNCQSCISSFDGKGDKITSFHKELRRASSWLPLFSKLLEWSTTKKIYRSLYSFEPGKWKSSPQESNSKREICIPSIVL